MVELPPVVREIDSSGGVIIVRSPTGTVILSISVRQIPINLGIILQFPHL